MSNKICKTINKTQKIKLKYMNGNTLTMNFQGINQSNNVHPNSYRFFDKQDPCNLLTNTLYKWSLILYNKSITKHVLDIYQFLLSLYKYFRQEKKNTACNF